MQTENETMKKPIEHNHDKMTKTYLENGIMTQANWNKQNRKLSKKTKKNLQNNQRKQNKNLQKQ